MKGNRFIAELGEGDFSYVQPLPGAVADLSDPRLTVLETIRCAWLQWRADCARDEIREARAFGVLDSPSIREYQQQADAYEAQIAAIEVAAFAREVKPQPGLFARITAGLLLAMLAVATCWHVGVRVAEWVKS